MNQSYNTTHKSIVKPGIRVKKYQRKTYAVWEITLKCNLACSHCGSRAGAKREDELSTTEALDLVKQMADLGIKEVTLIGGEAYLRPDWLMIASEIKRFGMKATMTTGGYGISAGTAKRMAQAGIDTVSVSIDGLAKEHDAMRGKQGSWEQCFKTLAHLKAAGITCGVNTQINRNSAHDLPMLYQKLVEAGVSAWQIQLTVPMGNAVEHNEMLLQPIELLDLYPLIYFLSLQGRKDNLTIQPGNNIGYYGPYERVLRGANQLESEWAFYQGCTAGQNVLGIEANGAIKGCPSLPSDAYTGGNIRERTLVDIYENAPEIRFNDIDEALDTTKHLWGHCKGCEFATTCRGGCNWTSHVFFGKRGNNPYCHHRVLKLAAKGRKERFYLKEAASGKPFDHGIFNLDEEEIGPLNPNSKTQFTLNKTNFPEAWLKEHPNLIESLYIERGMGIKRYIDSGIVSKEESPWYNDAHSAIN